MTYLGFLLRFLGPPLATLAGLRWRDARRGRPPFPGSGHRGPFWALLALVVVALLYTSPWDNYLVASQVWWYDPQRVLGVTLGWVPLEEYAFFVLQTLLTALWLFWLAPRLPRPVGLAAGRPGLRRGATAAAGLAWLGALALLASGWERGTYLGLELAWALPPVMLQLAFGADILWQRRRLVAPALLVPSLYLSVADALAIGQGTWTINPARSTGWLLGGVLPLEELVFFLLTNALIVFGLTLPLDGEGQGRLRRWLAMIRPSRARKAGGGDERKSQEWIG